VTTWFIDDPLTSTTADDAPAPGSHEWARGSWVPARFGSVHWRLVPRHSEAAFLPAARDCHGSVLQKRITLLFDANLKRIIEIGKNDSKYGNVT
jgi:hypothetical protein